MTKGQVYWSEVKKRELIKTHTPIQQQSWGRNMRDSVFVCMHEHVFMCLCVLACAQC